jgi:hypothetical protein
VVRADGAEIVTIDPETLVPLDEEYWATLLTALRGYR